MTHTGWRKPTPGLLQAERFAEVGEQLSVPKSQAIVAVKKIAAAIGLKSQDLLLLDTFGAVTQPQDWAEGRRPIVWASNHFLMEQTGFSLATLRRHVRRLCEVGVISMKDSPNGKRWGRRDNDGVIIEAYGFDLAPLAARTKEFEILYTRIQAERAACASLRNAITVTRRMIRAKIENALETGKNGPWTELKNAYSELLKRLPKRSEKAHQLESFLTHIKALMSSVEAAFQTAFNWPEHSDTKTRNNALSTEDVEPTSLENDTHTRTTKEPHPVKGNDYETSPEACLSPNLPKEEQDKSSGRVDLSIKWSTHGTKPKSNVDVTMLMASCPQFAEMARATRGYLRDWHDVHSAAASLRPCVGISEDAWNVANKVLGPAVAAASIALIIDKSSTGEVTSPGGYLRGLVQRAQAGTLHLERSFYGRLKGQAA